MISGWCACSSQDGSRKPEAGRIYRNSGSEAMGHKHTQEKQSQEPQETKK